MKIAAVISLCLTVFVAAYWLTREAPSRQVLAKEAAAAIKSRHLQEARDTVHEGLKHYPDDGQLLLLQTELEMLANDWESALKILDEISANDVEWYHVAKFTAGEIHRNNSHLLAAEAAYEEALSVSAEFMIAHQRLASLKRWTGRPIAAEVHLTALMHGGQPSVEHLVWLAAPGHLVKAESQLSKAHNAAPQDPLPQYGLGALAMLKGDMEKAAELFERGLTTRFDPEIHSALGQCLIVKGDFKKLAAWQEQIPISHLGHPDIHYTIGLIHETNNQGPEATIRFAACLRKSRGHKKALSHLAMHLNATGQKQRAETVVEVFQLVSQLGDTISRIATQSPAAADALQCSELLAQLGRIDEANLWSRIGRQKPTANRHREADAMPELRKILRNMELTPIQPVETLASPADSNTVPRSNSQFRFTDVASDQGIDFQYFESPDNDTEGRRMFEFTGGGVGVLDVEMDGFPDLYFTQGAEWPVNPDGASFLDALYRQVNGHFKRVDSVANIVEGNYSQGISIGDVNNDGFDDIYIANIGPNTLLFNNGDGTYQPAPSAIPTDSAWTTSCVIADLNSDGHADIYDVNYLTGPGWENKICPGPAGPRVCSPLAFEPAMDRLCVSTGQGNLTDESEAFGIAKAANGMGVVAANLDGDSQLELFVANDMMNNFLWDSRTHEEALTFVDASLLKGWALSSDGSPQACMGVAAADFNGDKHVDLLVTNYFNETNALYINHASGIAQEASSAFRLHGPSLPMLGFGTQAIDAELDGDWDLFVTNGDLDDFSHQHRPLLMPPQFFENLNNKRFEQVRAPQPGDYLSEHVRGRGMAKLDWNRDGLTDLAISHLDTPVALVTNHTPAKSGFLKLKLIGTRSHRNAIGTTVTLITASQSTSQQLTAGDGYQASNEKQLLFPISRQEQGEIHVSWPSGHIDRWAAISGNSEYIGVEGHSLHKRPQ